MWNIFGGKKKTPHELMAAGDLEGARRGFYDLLKKSGFDPVLQVQVADLNAKLGQLVEAKKQYVEVGQHYAEKGFFNKSVAVFKKALALNPDDTKILAQLASYNDRVPKFMIDERFLNRFRDGDGEVPQEVKAAIGEPPTEDTSPTEVIELAMEDEEDSPTPHEEAVEADLSASPDGDSGEHGLDHDPDYDAFQDMSVDISAEFEKELTSPPDLSALDSHQDDSFSDLFSMEAEEEDSKPSAEPVRGMGEARAPAEERVQPKAQESGQPNHRGKTVFSSREVQSKEEKSADSLDFSSFDDALNTIFDSGEVSPETEAEKAAHQKHWALFRTMPSAVFMDFVQALESRDYEVGKCVVRQGEQGKNMYLIAEGGVEVHMERDGSRKRMARLKEGDFFGEAALLTGEPRNASVVAVEPTHCLVLSRADLHHLTESHPSIMASIESIYYTRQKHNASRWQ